MQPGLSDREKQVLDYAVQGYTDDMIAQAMGIGRGTVNSYWVRIRGKLGHLSRTHLVANYVQNIADNRRESDQAANLRTAEEVAEANELLEKERAEHAAEREESRQRALDMYDENKTAMDKAMKEIERLRNLLADRKK